MRPDDTECGLTFCDHPRAQGMSLPICAKHARQVYMDAKDLVELASRIYPPEVIAQPSKSRRAKRNTLDEAGYVYFMLMPDGSIKVGFSTDVQARAKALRASAVLATLPGTRRDERAMHARLGPHWIEGEYFKDCKEVRAAMAEAAAA